MGGQASGALNASGFTASISRNQLPCFQHITHCGIFNQNFFNVGDKAKKLLEIHQGVGISNCDLYDLPKRNYFLSLFLKSNTDGQKRTRQINVVVCLDVSGSMGGLLKYEQHGIANGEGESKTRIQLARQAIWMLFQKLQDSDVFSLVTFHNTAKTIIKSTYKKMLDAGYVKNAIFSNFQTGGTTIKNGFKQSVKNIQQFRLQNTLSLDYQHRILMLTDVDDNSVQNEKLLINDISSQNNINTTIIGVSSDFKSVTCEQLVEVKGFNYFCAVENSDLQTYLADRFDYNFFPCVQNVQIAIESQEIDSFYVYGSVDSKKKYPQQGNNMIVTRMQTGFPSDLLVNKQGKVETQGGLILVKLKLKQQTKLPHLKVKTVIKYQDMKGQPFVQQYVTDNKLQVQQYFSDDAIEKGIRLFYYTQTMRNLLKDMTNGQNKLSDENKGLYTQKLKKLTEYSPKQKLSDIEKVIDIVQEQFNKKPQPLAAY